MIEFLYDSGGGEVYCKYCGTILLSKSVYCKKCGRNLHQVIDFDKLHNNNIGIKRSVKVFVWILITIFIVGVSSYIGYRYTINRYLDYKYSEKTNMPR